MTAEVRDAIDLTAPLHPFGTIAKPTVLNRYTPHLITTRNNHFKATAQATQ